MSRLTKRAENGAAIYATPSGEPIKWDIVSKKNDILILLVINQFGVR